MSGFFSVDRRYQMIHAIKKTIAKLIAIVLGAICIALFTYYAGTDALNTFINNIG